VPNPFNPRTTIFYELPETSAMSLVIHDVAGRVVRRLVDGVELEGSRSVVWDGTNDGGRPVPSGIYFCVMRAGGYEARRRMTLLK
jgi:flagellar hook assembly protein FlgD